MLKVMEVHWSPILRWGKLGAAGIVTERVKEMWFLFSAATLAAQNEEPAECILLQQQQKSLVLKTKTN